MGGLELGDGTCGGMVLAVVGAGDDHRSRVGAEAESFERFLHDAHATGIGRARCCAVRLDLMVVDQAGT